MQGRHRSRRKRLNSECTSFRYQPAFEHLLISAHANKKLYRCCCGSLLLLLATAFPLSAGADIFSFSLAAISGSAKYEQKDSPQNFSVNIQTLSLRGSFSFLDLLHVDAKYSTTLGKQDFSTGGHRSDAEFDNLSLWLRVGIPFPVPILNAYALVGLSNLEPEYSNSAVVEPSLNQGQMIGLGLGLDLPGLPMEIMMEYIVRPSQEYDHNSSRTGRARYSSVNFGTRWNF